ncbi:anthranilate synthase component I [Laceyella sacchari]|uniref:Anthranilate synthase component 1 n=1 Tax=Laceyella sacchari TaxID=37482 RepID=A0ABY5U5P3_LACSH|nr:anthranilate synthase component I [Laceyella sacchari]UWE04944.1 anthranilate synthase component I [Laceyella sacchari]
MIYPTYEECQSFSSSYSFIPICKTVVADTETPIRLFERVKDDPYAFLLESVEGGERWARYSMIGAEPMCVLKCKGNQVVIEDVQGCRTLDITHPMQFLKEWFSQFQAPKYAHLPPFLGGAVGYVGYEAVRFIEPTRPITHPTAETQHYDFHLMVADRLIIFDHLKQTVTFVQHLALTDGALAEVPLSESYRRAVEELETWCVETLQGHAGGELSFKHDISPDSQSSEEFANIGKEEYMELVRQAQEHIREGDIFQVVLSRKFTQPHAPDPFRVYRILRVLNPSPYMYYLRLGKEQVVGTSPERIIRVTDRLAEICPIAGTRPRGQNEREDQELMDELLNDEKEIAEHVMLLDLGRNDLGRVAEYGAVRVRERMVIEKYSHVMHLVSHLEATLKEGVHALEAFQACFPAGTLSGAPKIRAMELIRQFEPEPRGIYGGAILYLSFTGNLDSCIAIRTIHFQDQCATVQAGAGIVADSNPIGEYLETSHKAKGMLTALAMAKQSEFMEALR